MLTNQKRFGKQIQFLLMAGAVAWICGCMPAGPRALLRGKKLIDQGKYADAVDELKEATSLLATNAQAWNYLGLAYHHSGQAEPAMEAYERALKLDHDLVIVHYNLGCLLLEQNRPEALEGARNELTAYTLHQGNSVEGWLKLGTAQLRLGELPGAETSFREAYQLKPQSPEPLNDLGMVQLERRRWRDAAAYFNSALKAQPNYAPALLNLATDEVYLGHRPAALQRYREYLALSPRAPNWDAVNTTAQQLDEELNPTPRVTQPETTVTANPVTNTATHPAPVTNVANNPRPTPPPSKQPARVESATRPEPVRTAETQPARVAENNPPQRTTNVPRPSQDDGSVPPPDYNPNPAPKPVKRGFFERLNPLALFRRDSKPAATTAPTALPPAVPLRQAQGNSDETAPANRREESKLRPAEPRVVAVARYPYLLDGKPAAGNRAQAESLLTKGIEAKRDGRLLDAEGIYRQAVLADPSFFEAQNYLGTAALDLGHLPLALRSLELALDDKPESFDAGFHFGVALKRANYIVDAAEEFEKLLADHPGESADHLAAAHLELGNLYANQFHRMANARQNYLKVLQLDPQNSQGTAIRYWLQNNP
jgi:tetratricopeptide (TPR) repeat protein